MRPRNASAILSPFAHTCAHIADRPRRSRSKNASVYHPKAETSRGNVVALWRGRSGASETSVKGGAGSSRHLNFRRSAKCRAVGRPDQQIPGCCHSIALDDLVNDCSAGRLVMMQVRTMHGSGRSASPSNFCGRAMATKQGRRFLRRASANLVLGLRRPRRNNDGSADRHF
jgi:hypothetical protein